MASLPISDIVNVIINLSPVATARKNFNLAMILGSSKIIPKEERIREYSGLDGMLDDGFLNGSPEYKAAKIFLMQETHPKRFAIGYWDNENEPVLDAITECRRKNSEWYELLPLTQADQDIETLAAFVESATPSTAMSFTTEDKTLVAKLKGLNYRRTLAVVSPQPLMHVGIMGWAMGAQTGLRDSAYTLDAKTIIGMKTDDWDTNDIKEFKKINANYYICRGDTYDLFESGVMCDGTWFDEIINLDKLSNDMQLSIMDLFKRVKKVPATEAGVEMFRSAMIDPLEESKKINFIAPGIWTGESFMSLEKGDMIPLGYLILWESLASQSIADREQRHSVPYYIFVKTAGAYHDIVIQVNVSR